MTVIYAPKAKNSIDEITAYIEEKGYTETAENFGDRLYTFGNSLAVFPDKYPLCRFLKLAKRNLHCAVFESTYIFTYKVVNRKLIIYNVIHGKRLK
jgi:plasmid stabilization system protein ParE